LTPARHLGKLLKRVGENHMDNFDDVKPTRDFYIPREPIEEEKVEIVKIGKKSLQWRKIGSQAAVAKYKFKIYGKKDGANYKYFLETENQKVPNFLWNPLSENKIPSGIGSFEETKLEKGWLLRICDMHDIPLLSERDVRKSIPINKDGTSVFLPNQ